MRACFLGQNVCALGYGVAMVQTYPLGDSELLLHEPSESKGGKALSPEDFPLENLMVRDFKRQPEHVV